MTAPENRYEVLAAMYARVYAAAVARGEQHAMADALASNAVLTWSKLARSLQ